MGEAMKGVTKAMGQMNRQMNLPALQKIMQEFERQNERMEMVSEVMGDAIDDALEGDEEEEETEELVSQVLDEIGININSEVQKMKMFHFFSSNIANKYIFVEIYSFFFSLSRPLHPQWLHLWRLAGLRKQKRAGLTVG